MKKTNMILIGVALVATAAVAYMWISKPKPDMATEVDNKMYIPRGEKDAAAILNEAYDVVKDGFLPRAANAPMTHHDHVAGYKT